MALDMKPHVVQAYKDACDNLIYLKKEQFQITYYTWLVLAAIYILSRSLGSSGNPILFGGTFAVGFLSIVTLINFESEIARFRVRLDHIYADYFEDNECKRLGLDAVSGHQYACTILSLTVVVATLFTSWAVFQAPTGVERASSRDWLTFGSPSPF